MKILLATVFWYLSEPNAGSSGQTGESGNWTRYEVAPGRIQGKNVVVKLTGVDDRDAAQKLVGRQVAIDRDQLPTLSGDEFYWSDLLGFQVVDLQQRILGTLERMFETGANDVMVLRASDSTEALPTAGPKQEIWFHGFAVRWSSVSRWKIRSSWWTGTGLLVTVSQFATV